eukprot:IDg12385t1
MAKSGQTVPIKAIEKTARLLGRGTKTVSNVVKDWTADAASNPAAVDTSGSRANRILKEERIMHTKQCTSRRTTFAKETRRLRESDGAAGAEISSRVSSRHD